MSFRLFVSAALLALAGCSALPFNASPPSLSVAEVEVKSLGLLEQQFDVGLRVANPNDFDLSIEGVDFELEVNGRPFARGVSRSGVLVPAASTAVVRVDAVTQSANLIEQIQVLSPASLKNGVPYRIKGRIKTDRFPVWLPFDHRGVYGGGKGPSGREA